MKSNHWKSRANLTIFDYKLEVKNNAAFGKSIFKVSIKGVLLSIVLLLLFLIADKIIRWTIVHLDESLNNSISCYVVEFMIKNNFNIKKLELFADTISIGAGVLGVILGLSYTAYITIIATKYSNINSIISKQLLQQDQLNKYFLLLSTLTSLSLLLQLSLSFGYIPTIFSSIIIALFFVFALTSFLYFGKLSLVYLDASYLVNDLVRKNFRIIDKLVAHNKSINKLKNGNSYLYSIYNNISKIKLIIKETDNPQISNTSLDSVSRDLLKLLFNYNSIKHVIPSVKGWHLQISEFKSWEYAKEVELSILKSTGVDILEHIKDSHNLIEKTIFDAQFEIFKKYINDSERVSILFNQDKIIQVLSVQCDYTLFEYFFAKLEKFSFEKIDAQSNTNEIFKLQISTLYIHFLIHHVVGLNHNLKLFSNESIKKLAYAIHYNKNTDTIFQFPYYLRVWLDQYNEKLYCEYYLSNKHITPLHYTEFELAYTIQAEIQQYWKRIVKFTSDKVNKINTKLIDKKQYLEALQFNLDFQALNTKTKLFINNTNEFIDNLNTFNFQKDTIPFNFKDKDDLLLQSDKIYEQAKKNIWRLAELRISTTGKNIPDTNGSAYLFLLEDITDKLFNDKLNDTETQEYLVKFLSYWFYYIKELRLKHYDTENIMHSSSLIYPYIVDMFDLCSIAIIKDKVKGNSAHYDNILNSLGNCFTSEEDEKGFWNWVLSIYRVFSDPIYTLSTSSYSREHSRTRKLEEYLIESNTIVKVQITGSFRSYMEGYSSSIDDIYLHVIADSMFHDSISYINLNELFIEYELRTRILLKDINIKETNYGKRLRIRMEK